MERDFWILVDIGKDPEVPPSYHVVPHWWMVNHIHVRHHEGALRGHGMH
jgi:hypothetical protein